MLANTNSNLEYLVTQLLIDRRYEKAMAQGNQLYQIKQFKIASLPPNKIAQMYYLITTKFYFNRPPEPTQAWHQNELRVFIYLLVGYSYLEKRNIATMNEQDWQFFSQIFNFRDPIIFEFQALTILKRDSKCNKWDLDEVSLLDSIIRTKSIKNKWNEIARELFLRSKKMYFKTSKQCREYWINHLDPVPVRSCWTITEDYELVEAVYKVGKKWAKVSKMLGGRRTEHMVKNRFKSLYHFEEKQRQYFSSSERCESQIIQIMLNKFKVGKEEELKLSIFEKEFKKEHHTSIMKKESFQTCYSFTRKNSSIKGSNKQEEIEDESEEEIDDQGKNQCDEKPLEKTVEIDDDCKVSNEYFFPLVYPNKISMSTFKDFQVEDCISAFFEHDSFLCFQKDN